jgi:hypothetical protein
VSKVLLGLIILVVTAGSAFADTIGLTATEADSFVVVSTTGGSPFAGSPFFTGSGQYSIVWPANAFGPGSVTSGVTLLTPRGQTGDNFELTISNLNENPWDFAVEIFDGVSQTSGPFSIVNGNTLTFAFLLGGSLTQVYLIVSGDLPVAGHDRNAEYHVQFVPEPATLVLFGTGILFGLKKKRSRA